jgi:hypothetical protein
MIKLIEDNVPVVCKICDREFKDLRSFGQHPKTHNLTSKEYTIIYLLDNDIPKCKCGCGQKTSVSPYKISEYKKYHGTTTTMSTFLKNPDNWFINCSADGCDCSVKYDNVDAYKGALKRIKKGYIQYCLDCRPKYKKGNGILPIYSRNPDDWQIKCANESCDVIFKYKNVKTWVAAQKKINKGKELKCNSCRQIGRKLTDEQKQIRNIKFQETWSNKTDEEKLQYKKKVISRPTKSVGFDD